VVRRIAPAFLQARAAGLETLVFDFGGGFGVPTSREFTTWEFLAYQGWGRLPRLAVRAADFAPPLCAALRDFCRREGLPLPTLYLEPGRAIAGPAQVLLLTVGEVKERRGVGKWVISDGGAGTCAFPLYYECHEVLLASDVDAPPAERVAMVGSVCFASNWIYRKKRMPALRPGDVLAVMDAGAYFLALEANFGFPRTPVVMVSGGQARLVRRRETFEEMAARDLDASASPPFIKGGPGGILALTEIPPSPPLAKGGLKVTHLAVGGEATGSAGDEPRPYTANRTTGGRDGLHARPG